MPGGDSKKSDTCTSYPARGIGRHKTPSLFVVKPVDTASKVSPPQQLVDRTCEDMVGVKIGLLWISVDSVASLCELCLALCLFKVEPHGFNSSTYSQASPSPL